ncbi:class I SAM-dependent methyltransferase [Candidatus Bathyarchaeota archaeon]|nr:class I SAM-dependent methyltransferase [Candidatus Bathyarchaeota archaeon]
MGYIPEDVRRHYNEYGGKEWTRLEGGLHGRVQFEVTTNIISRYLKSGDHVLDAGSGPGRYAIWLTKRGARVFLVDISDRQLELAGEKIREAGAETGITGIERMDICDMQGVNDHSFDLTLCLGGALSYVRDRRHDALDELIRVTKPGAPIIISAMSLLGTFHLIGTADAAEFLEEISEHTEWSPDEPFPDVLDSRPGSPEWHTPMTLYTSTYMRELLADHGCEVLEMAAANTITSGVHAYEKIPASPEAEEMLIQLEKQFSSRPGLVDMGQHIIVVARTPA